MRGEKLFAWHHAKVAVPNQPPVGPFSLSVYRGEKLALLGGTPEQRFSLGQVFLGKKKASEGGREELFSAVVNSDFDLERQPWSSFGQFLQESGSKQTLSLAGKRKPLGFLLEAMQLTSRQLRTPIKFLGQREKNCFTLLRFLLSKADFLLAESAFDFGATEPSLTEILLQWMQDFPGALMVLDPPKAFFQEGLWSSFLLLDAKGSLRPTNFTNFQ